MNSNSENPRVGKEFQLAVKRWFEESLHIVFETERKIAIGSPPKLPSFDISDRIEKSVIE